MANQLRILVERFFLSESFRDKLRYLINGEEDYNNKIFESGVPIRESGIKHYQILKKRIFFDGHVKYHMKVRPLRIKEDPFEILDIFDPVHIFEWQHKNDKIIYSNNPLQAT